ncbi:hypothetical protein [Spirosoma areae]
MLIKFFAVLGIGCFAGFLLILAVFGPRTYRFLRDEYRAGRLRLPAWVYRVWHFLRRFVRNLPSLAELVFIASVWLITWLAVVIFC